MIFKPAQLGMAKLDQQELVEDKKLLDKLADILEDRLLSK